MQNQERDEAKLTLSVAMCSYNGAKYLQEQLDSIIAQTRLPDELVVCDDSSSNEINLGPTKNFEKAVTLRNGDIIALSDQDDVWIPHKLGKLEKVLKEYPKTGYVFSNALVVDANLHPLGYTMWDRVSFTARQRRRFEQDARYQVEVLLKHNVVTGATMAFRTELRDWILPIPDQWIHDAWIALLASAAGARGIFIKEALVKYRQHYNQVIGGRKISLGDQVQRALLTRGEAYSYEVRLVNRELEVPPITRDGKNPGASKFVKKGPDRR